MTPTKLPGVLRGHVAFAVLTTLVAGHMVDDSFLQPPAGTSATDHVVSGLLSLGALGVAVWRRQRARAGTAAVFALAVGVTGLVVGVEAVYCSTTVGPSGDDWTGLLAALAGLVLAAVGAAGLWTSRRTTGSLLRRWSRRLLRAVASVTVTFALVVPVGSAYLSTHVARAEVPVDQLGVSHEDVSLTTSDGLRLRGWYVPSRNGAAVLVFPGRKGTQAHARMLARHGYGVLLLDRRGEGSSDGAAHAYGWDGQRDVHAAVALLQQRPDVDPHRIGGIGLSVGGEMLLQAAAENAGLAAVVSDGAGIRTWAEARVAFHGGDLWFNAAPTAVTQAALMVFADSTPPPSLFDVVRSLAPRPVLLVMAPRSPNVEHVNRDYRRRIGASASRWEVPEADHVRALQARPTEYERRVVDFFDAALRERGVERR